MLPERFDKDFCPTEYVRAEIWVALGLVSHNVIGMPCLAFNVTVLTASDPSGSGLIISL
jgi:hypothetical protein